LDFPLSGVGMCSLHHVQQHRFWPGFMLVLDMGYGRIQTKFPYNGYVLTKIQGVTL